MATKPISPKDVVSLKRDGIPDKVIEAFNELIAKSWNGGYAYVKQEEVVALIKAKTGLDSTTGGEIYANNWLDVEDIYRQAGWIVTYDKPGYNENYGASFQFKKKPTR